MTKKMNQNEYYKNMKQYEYNLPGLGIIFPLATGFSFSDDTGKEQRKFK
jgi:hypothetical protein